MRAAADALLDGHGGERAVIVLGDLNDQPLAATNADRARPARLRDRHGRLPATRPRRPHAAWNLAPLIPEERRFTRVFHGRKELIDHILVSHALVTRVSDVDTGDVPPPSIGEEPSARRDEPASDHAPVPDRVNARARPGRCARIERRRFASQAAAATARDQPLPPSHAKDVMSRGRDPGGA